MATFLELCQAVAQESGTISTMGEPLSVVSQEGRLKRIVDWTAEAYRRIQTTESNWRWLRGEFSGETVAAQKRYTAAELGIAERFSRWDTSRVDQGRALRIYKTSEGVGTEQWIPFLNWDVFYDTRMIGSVDNAKPGMFSIDPVDRLVMHPTPDDAYTISGLYWKSPQELTANDDVPEMPVEFHDAIKWESLKLLGLFDESVQQYPGWERNSGELLSRLRVQQLPSLLKAGPIA